MDTGEVFNKIQHPFMMKTFKNLKREGSFLNLVNGIYEKLVINIIPNGETPNVFPPEIRNKTRLCSCR